MSFAEYKRQFNANPTVNPETGRTITVGGDKYNQLSRKYGRKSPRARRSPAGAARRSPVRRSPTRRTPTKVQRSPRTVASPNRLRKDPFEVLSDEAIEKVLYKLSEENRLLWANASPKVRAVYNNLNF